MKDLKKVRIPTIKSDQVCPIHKIKLIYAKGHKPFCPKCFQAKLGREKVEQARKATTGTITSILHKRSLVDTIDDFNDTFKSFKATKGSKEAMVGNMTWKLAQEYIKSPSHKYLDEYLTKNNKPLEHGKAMTTLLYGTPGEGKTHLAMAMLNAINEGSTPPQACLFINVVQLFMNIQESWHDPSCWWTEWNATNLLTGVDVLCLDDLGSESSMRLNADEEASTRRQMFIKNILDKQKRLIVTTNLTREQLSQVYNPKIVSRLFANSNGSKLDFTGISDKREM